jgi:hypothetical protein
MDWKEFTIEKSKIKNKQKQTSDSNSQAVASGLQHNRQRCTKKVCNFEIEVLFLFVAGHSMKVSK